jgi:hypothetical protein
MSPTAAASPRLLPGTPTFAPSSPVSSASVLQFTCSLPLLLVLGLSLSLYLFLLSSSSHTDPFACLPRTLSTSILAWEDEAQWAVVRQAKRESKNGNEVETLVALESEPASQPAREKDRADRCRPSAAAARQFLPTAGWAN